MRMAIIGGTGPQGRGLARRLAFGGFDVIVGSRSNERGRQVAEEIKASLREESGEVLGMENEGAVTADVDMVFVTVPFSGHEATLREIAPLLEDGQIVVDLVVPLKKGDPRSVDMPEAGSATEAAQLLLGDRIPVVGALHNVSASILWHIERQIDCDILVCGDSTEAKESVSRVLGRMGMTAYDCGSARSARCTEALTAVLIGLNMSGSCKHAGVRITGAKTAHPPEERGTS